MSVADLQQQMSQLDLDGWLVVSFRGSNPHFADLTGIPHGLSRRVACWIPRQGEPAVFGSIVDSYGLGLGAYQAERYSGLADFQQRLRHHLAGARTVAMEYTVDGANPVISRVDAGFVEWIRSLGIQVVSSGDLISTLVRWDAGMVEQAKQAGLLVDQVRARAYAFTFERMSSAQPATEHEVAEFILEEFTRAGLVRGGTDVAVNANAADPHYASAADRPVPVRPGDILLIDLWAKMPGEKSPYADSTWMGYCGDNVPAKLQRAFDAVAGGRDVAIDHINAALASGTQVRGREVDTVTRAYLIGAGYETSLRHRTGHSLGWHHGHGDGPNLDAIEFPDERVLAPGLGVTVEPGVYFDGEFGVRLEVSLVLGSKGATLTTQRQTFLTIPGRQ